MRFRMIINGKAHDVEVNQQEVSSGTSQVSVIIDGKSTSASVVERDESTGLLKVKVNEREFRIGLDDSGLADSKSMSVNVNDIPFQIELDMSAAGMAHGGMKTTPSETRIPSKLPEPIVKATPKAVSIEGKLIRPPMPGKIIAVRVNEGDAVKTGDVVLILEAMKMANEIKTPYSGRVKEVRVSSGQSVSADEVLVLIE